MYKKHCIEEKQRAVELYSSGHGSEFIGRELEVDLREVRRWLAKYQRFGVSGLAKQLYTHATADFKTQVVRSVLEKSLSLDVAALHYGVSRSSVRCWVKQVKAAGYASLTEHKPRGRPRKNMGRPKKREPQTELEKLQVENGTSSRSAAHR